MEKHNFIFKKLNLFLFILKLQIFTRVFHKSYVRDYKLFIFDILKMSCKAKEYGECYGYREDREVKFLYRDNSGYEKPDEIINVCMCVYHNKWLSKIHQNKPFEMRGECVEYALYDDLFIPFESKNRMYTLLKCESKSDKANKLEEVNDIKFFLINGRDIEKFRTLMMEEDKNIIQITEEGFFQTDFQYIDGLITQVIIEVKKISGEMQLESLSDKLAVFYKPIPDSEMVNVGPMNIYESREEENPTIKTEYVLEPIPNLFKIYFTEKQKKEHYKKFQDCIDFISYEICNSIIKWNSDERDTNYTELFESYCNLTTALIINDESAIKQMQIEGKINENVLWITYITANHRLFSWSSNNDKSLVNNTKLIELFIEYKLETNLLALAISGERVRMLSVKMRDHYNILYENEFVVRFLVPKYITNSTIIYKIDDLSLNPIEYWEYFSNTTTYIGGGCFSLDNDETFKKNESILHYLENFSKI